MEKILLQQLRVWPSCRLQGLPTGMLGQPCREVAAPALVLSFTSPGTTNLSTAAAKLLLVLRPVTQKKMHMQEIAFFFFLHSLIIRHDKTLLKAVVTLSNHSCEI